MTPSADRLLPLVDLARQAPSVLNSQPWRFRVADGVVELRADRARQLRALDPDGREMIISCGAALAALRLAARHDGLRAHLGLLRDPVDPDLLARVTFEPADPPDDDRLLRALRARRTHRRAFAPDPIPAADRDALIEAADTDGAWLRLLTVADTQAAVGDLVAEAVLAQGQQAPVVAEIRAWLRPDPDPRPDGVRDGDQGRWDRLASLRTPVSAVAVHKGRLLREAPAVAVLGTAVDTPEAWLRAGIALGDVLVLAADRGLAVSYANEPIEMGGAFRRRLAALVGEAWPQVLLRMGRPEAEPGAARRPLRDVVEVGPSAPPPGPEAGPSGPGFARLPTPASR